MSNNLKGIFFNILESYNVSSNIKVELWNEIETQHSDSSRHYHNLHHLVDLYVQLEDVKLFIENWNVVLFTLFYHDIVYDASKNNNEEKSADIAIIRMRELGVNQVEISKCKEQILATKTHLKSVDLDANFFTDADLSILGRDWNNYKIYCSKVRSEYSIYPNFLYKRGRRKVLSHFLTMDRIYKTEEFFSKYEKQAKLNMEKELSLL